MVLGSGILMYCRFTWQSMKTRQTKKVAGQISLGVGQSAVSILLGVLLRVRSKPK